MSRHKHDVICGLHQTLNHATFSIKLLPSHYPPSEVLVGTCAHPLFSHQSSGYAVPKPYMLALHYGGFCKTTQSLLKLKLLPTFLAWITRPFNVQLAIHATAAQIVTSFRSRQFLTEHAPISNIYYTRFAAAGLALGAAFFRSGAFGCAGFTKF